MLQYRNIFLDRCYLSPPLALAPGGVVVDVGANVGLAAIFFHAAAPGARIHAFEPDGRLHAALAENFASHGVHGDAFNVAVSDRCGEGTLVVYVDATAMSGLYADLVEDRELTRRFLRNSGLEERDVDDLLDGRHRSVTQRCELTTLSAWLHDGGPDQIDLLKVNVEKSEEDVLAGLAPEHWPRIRQVVMQVHDLGGRLRRLYELLEARGFRVHVHQQSLLAGTPIYECVAVRPGGSRR